MRPVTRRHCLQTLGALGAGLLGLGMLGAGFSGCQSKLGSANGAEYQVPEWTGDTFGPMHRIRDGAYQSIPKPSSQHDVVIVGGGLSGLTVASQLLSEDWLLLERENTVGGNAKSGVFQGVKYALGSAYLVDVGAPYGPFYEELGLTLKPLSEPADYLMAQNPSQGMPHEYSGPWRATPLASSYIGADLVGQDFERMRQYLTKLLKQPNFPGTPVQEASSEALGLDRLSFGQFLRAEHYGEGFIQLVNAYCWSALGGSVDQISAYAGLNFYSEIAGPVYAFGGGNARVAEAIHDKIKVAGAERVKTGVAVYQVTPQANGDAWVSYVDMASGEVFTVAAKTVVMAVPYFFAARLLPHLNQQQAQQMKSLQYGSYLVGNLCFDRPVLSGAGYDHWTPNLVEGPGLLPFTDFIDAGFAERGGHLAKDGPSVMTVYAPFKAPWPGRTLLKQGDKAQMAKQLVNSFRQVVPFSDDALKSVRLTRYGHQLLSSEVGIIQKIRGIERQHGPVILAHSDGQGMAAIESAVLEGLHAAQRCKSLLKAARIQTAVSFV